MRIQLHAAGVGAGRDAEVPALTVAIAPGAPVVIAVETDDRPKLVSLLLGGRLRPTTGAVTIPSDHAPAHAGDDEHRRDADAAQLRRRVALIDTPFTSEPPPTVALRTVVAEELAFAGRPSGRRAVRAVLERHGLADAATRPMGVLPAAIRIRLLVDLALARPDVESLVLTAPERHGGDPGAWFPALAERARRLAIAVVTDVPTAAALEALGAVRTAPEPELAASGPLDDPARGDQEFA